MKYTNLFPTGRMQLYSTDHDTIECYRGSDKTSVAALTGRNMTGPPHAAPWWVTLHMHRVTDDRWRQTPTTVTRLAPYIMCKQDSRNVRVLKMICNDSLVVEVNWTYYVFNINKSISILRNIKKLGNFRKKRQKVRTRWFVYYCKWWRHSRKTNKGTGYWSVEWDITQHIGITT